MTFTPGQFEDQVAALAPAVQKRALAVRVVAKDPRTLRAGLEQFALDDRSDGGLLAALAGHGHQRHHEFVCALGVDGRELAGARGHSKFLSRHRDRRGHRELKMVKHSIIAEAFTWGNSA